MFSDLIKTDDILASFSFSNLKKTEYMLKNILTFDEKEFKKPSLFRKHLNFSN